MGKDGCTRRPYRERKTLGLDQVTSPDLAPPASGTFCRDLQYYTMTHLTLKPNTLSNTIRLSRAHLPCNLIWASLVSGTGRETVRLCPTGYLISTLTVPFSITQGLIVLALRSLPRTLDGCCLDLCFQTSSKTPFSNLLITMTRKKEKDQSPFISKRLTISELIDFLKEFRKSAMLAIWKFANLSS